MRGGLNFITGVVVAFFAGIAGAWTTSLLMGMPILSFPPVIVGAVVFILGLVIAGWADAKLTQMTGIRPVG